MILLAALVSAAPAAGQGTLHGNVARTGVYCAILPPAMMNSRVSRRSSSALHHLCAAIAFAVAIALFAVQASAQFPLPSPTAPAPTPVTAPTDTSTLVVFGRPIIVFRSPLGAAWVRERSDAASRRIADAIADSETDSVRLQSHATGVLLSIGDRPAFIVTTGDVDSLAGETVQSVATAAAQRLTTAIAADREARSVSGMLRSAGLALFATVLFGIALYLLRQAQRAKYFARKAIAAAPRVGIEPNLGTEQLHAVLGSSGRFLWTLVALALTYVWLTFVLTRFPHTRPLGHTLGTYLFALLHRLALQAAGAIPGLLTVAVIFILTRAVTRIITLLFDAIEKERIVVPILHADTAQASRRILVILAWLFAIVVAYPYIPGSDTGVFKGVSVFVGLIVSLGSSSVVNQAMSGLFLTYSRAYRKGEYLQIGETEGKVLELGVLTTRLRTMRGEFVTIPNSTVAGLRTVNYSRLAQNQELLVTTTLRIGYDVPWRQVHQLLLDAAARTAGIARDPKPFVLQKELSDFSIEYDLVTHIEVGVSPGVTRTALSSNILDQFNEHSVQIMTPHYEGQPADPVVVAKEHWHGRVGGAKPAAPPA